MKRTEAVRVGLVGVRRFVVGFEVVEEDPEQSEKVADLKKSLWRF